MTNQQFAQEIDELYAKAKRGELEDRQARMDEIEALTERYFAANGEMPDYRLLDRLATLCLREEISDSPPDKMTREESPIMSGIQEDRRSKKHTLVDEVSVGKDKTVGYRKTWYEDDNGGMRNTRQRIYDFPSI